MTMTMTMITTETGATKAAIVDAMMGVAAPVEGVVDAAGVTDQPPRSFSLRLRLIAVCRAIARVRYWSR